MNKILCTLLSILWASSAYALPISNKSLGGIIDILQSGSIGDVMISGGEGEAPYFGTYPFASQWTTVGSKIYYDSGNVGIGESDPQYLLHVDGQTFTSSLRLAAGSPIGEFSTDGTLAGNEDIAVPTEKAVKTYVDAAIGGIPADTGMTQLTGDVTASGSGSVAATIANGAVTYAKMQDMTVGYVLGRMAAGDGPPTELPTTGTGAVVFSEYPEITDPKLGDAEATTLDTGQGAYELYAMNQDVETTDSPTFAGLVVPLITSTSARFQLSQNSVYPFYSITSAAVDSTLVLRAGKVGIGIAIGDGTLHVNSSSAGAVSAGGGGDDLVIESSGSTGMTILSGTSGTGSIRFGYPGDASAGRITYGSSSAGSYPDCMLFQTAGGSGLTLDSTGRLGINTGTPGYTLDVNGTANFNTVTTGDLKLTNSATVGYVWTCTNVDGSGEWDVISASQVYKGTWNATTNTPTLADGTGTVGWYYRVTTAGTVDLGSGNITFAVGDDVYYNGATWELVPGSGYTLQAMTSSVLGGAKLGGSLQINSEVLNVNNADFGDITVTGTGADVGKIWTIDNQAVTYAKIQNVSIEGKVLGRDTVGAGPIEEINTTGTGMVVRNNTPTMLTPILGVASATTLNTGFGDNELYPMDQSMLTSASPTFAGLVVPSITPAGNFELNQNSVQPFTSIGASAVDNTLYLKGGKVGIGTASPSNPLTVIRASYPQVVIGGSVTDSTIKYAMIAGGHYDTSEEPLSIVYGYSGSSESIVMIGGGPSQTNAATKIQFVTASDTTTTTGSVRATINSSGSIGIGTTTPSTELDVVGTGNFSTSVISPTILLTTTPTVGYTWQCTNVDGSGGWAEFLEGGNLGTAGIKTSGSISLDVGQHNITVTGNVTGIGVTGGGDCADGYILVIRKWGPATDFLQQKSTNIRLQSDFYFDTAYDTLTLMSTGGGYWVEIARTATP